MTKFIDIVTDIARFWFLLLMLYMLIRVVDNALMEYNAKKRIRRAGPGRYFGYLTIVACTREENLGAKFGLKWENSIGGAKYCDICIRGERLQKHHAVLHVAKDGVYLSQTGRAKVLINGQPAQRKQTLKHKDVLQVGNAKLKLDLKPMETIWEDFDD